MIVVPGGNWQQSRFVRLGLGVEGHIVTPESKLAFTLSQSRSSIDTVHIHTTRNTIQYSSRTAYFTFLLPLYILDFKTRNVSL